MERDFVVCDANALRRGLHPGAAVALASWGGTALTPFHDGSGTAAREVHALGLGLDLAARRIAETDRPVRVFSDQRYLADDAQTDACGPVFAPFRRLLDSGMLHVEWLAAHAPDRTAEHRLMRSADGLAYLLSAQLLLGSDTELSGPLRLDPSILVDAYGHAAPVPEPPATVDPAPYSRAVFGETVRMRTRRASGEKPTGFDVAGDVAVLDLRRWFSHGIAALHTPDSRVLARRGTSVLVQPVVDAAAHLRRNALRGGAHTLPTLLICGPTPGHRTHAFRGVSCAALAETQDPRLPRLVAAHESDVPKRRALLDGPKGRVTEALRRMGHI